MPLSDQQISKLKTALIDEQSKARQALDKDVDKLLHPDTADLSEALGGGVDDAVYAGQVSLDMTRSISDSDKLVAINQALERIDASRYGVCGNCDEEIGFARLMAMPWASRCVDCEQKLENLQDERDATPSL